MKRILSAAAIMCSLSATHAQTAQDYAIQLSATTQVSPPSINLKWRKISYGTPVYNVFKKAKSATSWGTAVSTITTGDTSYTDNSVIVDSAYEYMVAASGTSLAATPTGYIFAGIKAPAIHVRGALIMLVDSTFTDSCSTELARLSGDINGDGWQVIRHDLSRSLKDTAIKTIIRNDYTNIPNVKAVLIVGHLAVPYSGELNPDAHPDHLGAWPADIYYGSITGTWTDVSVNNSSASAPANRNIPGDGKWDQSSLGSYAQLQVSRIDFNNMPAFSATEVQMMRRYLNKDHSYKMDSLAVRKKALVSDNFGAFSGEAFAANAWRNFTPMVGRDSIFNKPFISTLSDTSYQWAYGCGGGSYTSAGGIGNTGNFASAGAVHSIFTIMFGSYFGDWNTTDNFLRAPLCADTPALTACWAGRPNWFLHHMTLGEHIGYGALLTNNNGGSLYYPANYAAAGVHIALLGDLSLRTDYVKQASNLNATPVAGHGANLTWTASPDAAVIGYYLYRADSAFGYWSKISPLVTGTSWSDTVGINGLKHYMVRPVKLQSTPSGSYYNMGIGITDTATVTFPAIPTLVPNGNTSVKAAVFPNPVRNELNLVVDAAVEDNADIYIVSLNGSVLYPATKHLMAGQNVFQLDVSTLPAGMYTVCIRTQTGTIAQKWVKYE
jgi:hypothetical protein